MSKHTPGPWFVTKIPNRTELGSDVLIRERRPLRGDVPTWIAEVSAKDEQMANANLIAAAPDLLAACEAALTQDSVSPDAGEVYNQIHDAIRKANGE